MIEVTPQERAEWAELLANRPGRSGTAAPVAAARQPHVHPDGHPHAHQASEPDHEPTPAAIDEWTLGSTQVFAIASGKGGVGKSTITSNLAAELARRGLAVGVLDADLNGFSLPRMLGASTKAEKQGDLLSAGQAHQVKLMSLGMFANTEDAVVWRGPVMNRALEQFLGETDWGELEVLLVDLPPGTGDVAISIAQLLPQAEVIIVTTPQMAAAEVAARAGAMTKHTHQRVRGVVENMSWLALPDGTLVTPFGSGGGELVAAKLTQQLGEPISLLAQIPLADAVRIGSDNGIPVVLSTPESDAAHAIQQLASALIPSGQ